MSTSGTYTLEQCIDHLGLGRFQWRFSVVLGFYMLTEALEMMLLSVLGPALQCYWPDVTDVKVASLTSFVFVGMMIGSFFFGIMADKYGRRKIIFISAILLAVFGVLTTFAPNYNSILVMRTLVGIALAGGSPASTLIIEFLPSSTRALFCVYSQLFWAIGCIYVFTLAMLVMPLYGWRLFTLLCALPSVIIVLFIYFIPESPRYYVASGQHEKAEDVLKKIATINNRSLPEGKLMDVEAESECGSLKQLFHMEYRKTTILLAYMWFAACFGYYGIILLSTTLMAVSNDKNSSLIQSNITNSTRCKMLATNDYIALIFTTFGEIFGIPLLLLFISYFNRRTISIMQYSFGTLCFAMFLVAQNELKIISIITFFGRMFLNSQLTFIYVYTIEVYPTVIRAMAVGCGSAIARTGPIVVPYLAQALIKTAYYTTISIFVVVTGLAALCAYLLPIETKGRELKQAIIGSINPLESSDRTAELLRMQSVDDEKLLINIDNDGVKRRYETIMNDKTKPATAE
ncbi:hypothetical protein I4U23_018491 [Adineta vaga]|nr:hypothetical protein I4U23_018491 [Adineta vaga]